jgi:hypothetical protein
MMEMDPFVESTIDEIIVKDPMLSNASINLPEPDDFYDDVDFNELDKENIPPADPSIAEELDPAVSEYKPPFTSSPIIHSQTIYCYQTPPLVSPLPSPGLIEKPEIMTPKAPVKRTRKASTEPTRRRKVAEKPEANKSSNESGDEGENEVASMMKNAVAKRAKTVQQRLAEVNANNGEVTYEPKTKYGWLFTIEKSLRYTLCDNCVKLYLKDEDKITEFENGYVMLNLMLCQSCVSANNDVKRAWKHGFGKKWEGGTWGSGGGGGGARGGWGGNNSPRGYYAAGGSRF